MEQRYHNEWLRKFQRHPTLWVILFMWALPLIISHMMGIPGRMLVTLFQYLCQKGACNEVYPFRYRVILHGEEGGFGRRDSWI